MNNTYFSSYPILSFPIATLLLTLFFIFLLYIPRFLFLYVRTHILHFWARNIKRRMSHFEALDLVRAQLDLENGNGIAGARDKINEGENGNGKRDGKRKSKKHWWDIDLVRGEEENEWVTKGEMAKEWICEGEEKWEMRRLEVVGNGNRVAEESRWLHFVGRDVGEGESMDGGVDEKGEGAYEKEELYEIPMRDKELDG